ncbi:hypothetical protein [Bradyrhizobium sp. CCBAU 51765]|uniref:hypothetical protein n=1 Tax=Bradyrhizobium sp. CCBAU 51765 TaxID=1325102 RepID=UPI00188939C0|nr:hypothetical protein [Bradyrhizobium sp. CCBAU 51765]QOZ11863.1 hypothetical protein XH96_33790 [Bradyrhizobium sp. CCBAU 51765]
MNQITTPDGYYLAPTFPPEIKGEVVSASQCIVHSLVECGIELDEFFNAAGPLVTANDGTHGLCMLLAEIPLQFMSGLIRLVK